MQLRKISGQYDDQTESMYNQTETNYENKWKLTVIREKEKDQLNNSLTELDLNMFWESRQQRLWRK